MKYYEYILASALVLKGVDAFALSEREFSYAVEPVIEWGTGLQETYDVAIRLSGNGLEGTKIKSFTIPLAGEENLTDLSLWISSNLALEGKKNIPDIMSEKVLPQDGKATIVLEEPIDVVKGGLYIGCTFSVSSLTPETKAPLSVSETGNSNSFFIHTSRKYAKWGNYNLGFALDLKVTLLGDFKAQDIELVNCREGNVVIGNLWTPVISVRNLGTEKCVSFAYNLTIDEEETLHSVILPESPLNPSYGYTYDLELDAVPVSEAGSYKWRVEITEVNGLPNTESLNAGESELFVWPYGPERTPLMEEYTGTWCGWCPRGAIGMELMEEKYGDNFVGVAYHTDASKDPMATLTLPPTKYEGAPWSVLDRTMDADPFYGLNHGCTSFTEGIEAAWLVSKGIPTPAEISGEAYFTDKDNSSVTVETEIMFVRDFTNRDIRLLYFLIEDGLTGSSPEWMQSNYFSNQSEFAVGDLSVLYSLPRKVPDYEFNHVMVYTPDEFGIKGSLPENIESLKRYSHSIVLPLDKAVNADGNSLIQDKSKLHIVAAVVDATDNTILNCKKLAIGAESGLERMVEESGEKSEVNFDILGRRVSPDYKGLQITGDGKKIYRQH